jgi:hypothetical protein
MTYREQEGVPGTYIYIKMTQRDPAEAVVGGQIDQDSMDWMPGVDSHDCVL